MEQIDREWWDHLPPLQKRSEAAQLPFSLSPLELVICEEVRSWDGKDLDEKAMGASCFYSHDGASTRRPLVSFFVGNRGGRSSYSPKRSSSEAVNETSQENQSPGTHFGQFLGHGPGSWSKGHRDHARGLLSQQWNMGFP